MTEQTEASQHTLFKGARPECVFCQIVRKEIPSEIVFEDKDSSAFLDSRPLFPGHVLLVPRAHYKELGEMPDVNIGILFNNAKRISRAVEKAIPSDGTFIAVNNKVSQSVPHLHIHIVPRKFKDGLKGFFWPRYKYRSPEEAAQIGARIAQELREAHD